jgi:hypothetical protein
MAARALGSTPLEWMPAAETGSGETSTDLPYRSLRRNGSRIAAATTMSKTGRRLRLNSGIFDITETLLN